jgi:putative transposase
LHKNHEKSKYICGKSDVNSQSLLNSLINLESAFTRFFREKKGFPNFKSKKNPLQSFQIPQHYTVDFETNTIKLPKIKQPVKAKLHETVGKVV